MKLTKQKLKKMGWSFGSSDGERAFVALINKTMKTEKAKKDFLDLFNQPVDKIIGKRIYKNKII